MSLLLNPVLLKATSAKTPYPSFKNQIKPPENSHYKDIYEKMGKYKRTKETKKNIPGPEALYKKVKHALESKSPKIRYLITKEAYLVSYLKRVFPDKLLDVLVFFYLNRKYGKS